MKKILTKTHTRGRRIIKRKRRRLKEIIKDIMEDNDKNDRNSLSDKDNQ